MLRIWIGILILLNQRNGNSQYKEIFCLVYSLFNSIFFFPDFYLFIFFIKLYKNVDRDSHSILSPYIYDYYKIFLNYSFFFFFFFFLAEVFDLRSADLNVKISRA